MTENATTESAATNPRDILADPALSREQKAKMLDRLEQDARQLAAAAEEGMSGGEATGLRDVLIAQETLDHSSADDAYAAVLADLKSRRSADLRPASHAVIDHAIAALEAVCQTAAARNSAAPDSSGAGTDAEISEETKLEKLDP